MPQPAMHHKQRLTSCSSHCSACWCVLPALPMSSGYLDHGSKQLAAQGVKDDQRLLQGNSSVCGCAIGISGKAPPSPKSAKLLGVQPAKALKMQGDCASAASSSAARDKWRAAPLLHSAWRWAICPSAFSDETTTTTRRY